MKNKQVNNDKDRFIKEWTTEIENLYLKKKKSKAEVKRIFELSSLLFLMSCQSEPLEPSAVKIKFRVASLGTVRVFDNFLKALSCHFHSGLIQDNIVLQVIVENKNGDILCTRNLYSE